MSGQFFGVIGWESEKESSAFLLRQQQPREEKEKSNRTAFPFLHFLTNQSRELRGETRLQLRVSATSVGRRIAVQEWEEPEQREESNM